MSGSARAARHGIAAGEDSTSLSRRSATSPGDQPAHRLENDFVRAQRDKRCARLPGAPAFRLRVAQ